MNYTLSVGVDGENGELVIGIVGKGLKLSLVSNVYTPKEYFETYTWGKWVGTWVKSTFSGLGKEESTVMSPKQYQARFRSAMERYFPLVRSHSSSYLPFICNRYPIAGQSNMMLRMKGITTSSSDPTGKFINIRVLLHLYLGYNHHFLYPRSALYRYLSDIVVMWKYSMLSDQPVTRSHRDL